MIQLNYYQNIKDILVKNEIYKQVKDYSKNKHDLESYYEVGKLLVEAQGGEERAKYGNKLIKEYSIRLTKELGKGYTLSSLKRMRQFYLMIQKGAAMPHQLTWSHIVELLPLKDIQEIKITEMKPTYIGQVLNYMKYTDKNIKESYHKETIGVIICKKENGFVLEYCTNYKIFTTTYKLINV